MSWSKTYWYFIPEFHHAYAFSLANTETILIYSEYNWSLTGSQVRSSWCITIKVMFKMSILCVPLESHLLHLGHEVQTFIILWYKFFITHGSVFIPDTCQNSTHSCQNSSTCQHRLVLICNNVLLFMPLFLYIISLK